MADIEIRLFRYFAMVAEERHFSRAAERLGITPPTLTHQIQELERRLGVRLCIRKPKTRVELTETGSRFLEQAQKVLRQAEEAERGAQGGTWRDRPYRDRLHDVGKLRRTGAGMREGLPARTSRDRDQSSARQTLTQLNRLAQNEIDIGFARPPNQYPPGLGGFVIHRQPLVSPFRATTRSRTATSHHARGAQGRSSSATHSRSISAFRLHRAVTKLAGFAPNDRGARPTCPRVLTYVSAGFGIGVARDR